MINPILGWAERGQLHKHCVNRVKSHLKRTCDDADKERGLVSGRITDAWGYNRGEKTWFLCEIKVNIKDLQKGVTQIHDTCFRFKVPKRGDKVIPVIAIPNKLYNEMRKYEPGQWRSFSSLCKNTDIAVWVVEQSNIRQIQGPKPTTPKPKATTKPKTASKPKATIKAKVATKPKSVIKVEVASKPKSVIKVKATSKPKAVTKAKVSTKHKSVIKAKATTKPKSVAKAKATKKPALKNIVTRKSVIGR